MWRLASQLDEHRCLYVPRITELATDSSLSCSPRQLMFENGDGTLGLPSLPLARWHRRWKAAANSDTKRSFDPRNTPPLPDRNLNPSTAGKCSSCFTRSTLLTVLASSSYKVVTVHINIGDVLVVRTRAIGPSQISQMKIEAL